jgi:hypothetical protein
VCKVDSIVRQSTTDIEKTIIQVRLCQQCKCSVDVSVYALLGNITIVPDIVIVKYDRYMTVLYCTIVWHPTCFPVFACVSTGYVHVVVCHSRANWTHSTPLSTTPWRVSGPTAALSTASTPPACRPASAMPWATTA